MRYKEFGKTGMQVSEMCLGTWGIGGSGWDSYSDETRLDALCAAFENGVNFVDTAPAYNAGEAERYVGRALKKMGNRKDIIISTKCGNEFIDGKYVRCGSADRIYRQCEMSLKNLQTDYIDLYLIHWPDPKVSLTETMGALSDLKKQGKILHIGVSNLSKEQILEVQQCDDIEAFQPQYSMVCREKEELIRWAADQGMGVMTYGSLGAGILTGAIRELKEYDPEDNRRRFYKFYQEPMFSQVMKVLTVMDEIAAERHVPLAQIALNWCAQKSFVSSCIVGAQTRKKVEENCAAYSWKLTQEEIQKLDGALDRYLK